MGREQANPLDLVEWGVSSRALPGQDESGDTHLVQSYPTGTLLAVVDGLGHGDEAAAAARLAVTTLGRHGQEPLTSLLHLCHEKLKSTRGVVMSLARFSAQQSTMTWLGVGNVDGILLRANQKVRLPMVALVMRGGVVGYKLPPLRESVLPVAEGDTLIFWTDGVRPHFAEAVMLGNPPRQMAERILDAYGKETDDALVLVARYLGGPPHDQSPA